MKEIFDTIKERALTLYDNSKDVMNLVKKGIPNFDPNFFSTRRQLQAPQGTFGFDQPYQQSVWIYAANKTISQSVAKSPFMFFTEGEEIEREVLPNEHEINQLFDNPNPMMSRQEIIFATMIFLGLDGEAFWIIDRGLNPSDQLNPKKFPENIWVFRKNFFQYELDEETGLVKYWKFEGQPKILLPHNVIHFKYFNPDDHFSGLAPWRAASLSSEQDYYASNYNTNFFKSGASIGGFLETEESLDDEQYDRLLSSIEDCHQGHEKSHRLMLLEGGLAFKEAKLSQRDMEFIETKKLTKSEILAAYGTNPVVLGDFNDVKSEAGVRAILKDFWTRVVIPNQNYIEHKIYTDFLRYYDDDIRVFFDNAGVEVLQDDLDTLLDRATKLFAIGYTINIINKRLNLGMPEMSHGDFAYLSGINLARIDESGNLVNPLTVEDITEEDVVTGEEPATDVPDPEATESEEEEQDEEEAAEEEEARKHMKMTLKEMLISKTYQHDHETTELEVEDLVILFLLSQELEVLAKVTAVDNYVNTLFTNIKSNEEVLATGLQNTWRSGYKRGYEKAAIEVDYGILYSPISPDAVRFIKNRLDVIPGMIFDTVKKGVDKAIKDFKGDSVEDLKADIAKVYEIARQRAKLIGTTEATASVNAGRYEVFSQPLSKVQKIKWITRRDNRVRGLRKTDTKNHVVLDSQVVVVGQFFKRFGLETRLRFPGDSLAPADDIIMCRCFIVGVKND